LVAGSPSFADVVSQSGKKKSAPYTGVQTLLRSPHTNGGRAAGASVSVHSKAPISGALRGTDRILGGAQRQVIRVDGGEPLTRPIGKLLAE
jgi:hypothetical protein